MKTFIADKSIIDRLDTYYLENLQRLAAIHRINCLAGLKSANHGWLGACFSSMELLTCIYHRYIINPLLPITKRASLHLSKGHAAMAQYAVLAGLGCFSMENLLTYKKLGGLPAHCDRTVPGVDSDSGSLGQGLSKAIGNAMSNNVSGKDYPVFAIIGDGEMQEGQVFEALLTLAKHHPKGLVPILDRNFMQSDSQTVDIKDAADWAKVLEGIGFIVYEIDGHDAYQIIEAINKVIDSDVPSFIIANTVKGAGTSITAMSKYTPRRMGVWHGKVPSDEEYLAILDELVKRVDLSELSDSFIGYKAELKQAESRPVAKSAGISTGEAFAKALEAHRHEGDILVFDADLEKACKLVNVAEAFGKRYKEIGISEQDMASIAAGVGLTGKIAVINTYGSFYKRSLDQIFAIVTEKVPVIIAGHYSGADYFTDGKSHQSVTDIALMRSLGDIEVWEPVDEASTATILYETLERMRKEFAKHGQCKPAYIRLHRTPCDIKYGKEDKDGFMPVIWEDYNRYPLVECQNVDKERQAIIFTSGPHMLKEAVEASKKLLEEDSIGLNVVPVLKYSDENKALKNYIKQFGNKVFTLEDHRRENGLGAFIASLEFKNPVRIGVRNYAQSALSLNDMLKFHNITSDDVCNVVRKVFSCKDHK